MADEIKFTSLDVAGFERASAYAKDIAGDAKLTNERMSNLVAITQELATAKAKMAGMDFISPAQLGLIKEIEKGLSAAGVTQSKIAELTREAMLAEKGMLLTTNELTKKEEKFLNLKMKGLETAKMWVRTEKGLVELGDRKKINANELWGSMKKTGSELKGFATSTAGVQLSLVGIIALILEGLNVMRKIGAMSHQASVHWGNIGASAARANKTIWDIHTGFKKSVDESGALVIGLARTGFTSRDVATTYKSITKTTREQVDLTNQLGVFQGGVLSSNIKIHGYLKKQTQERQTQYGLAMMFQARETEYGVSVSTQAKTVKELAMGFDISATGADNMAGAVMRSALAMHKAAEDGTDIGNALSVEDVLADWAELSQKTRAYNTDLMGTLAIYNTLMRKDIAKSLGLGGIPAAARRDIAKTFAGMSAELADGWKAALGEGGTPAEAILNFESMGVGKQIESVANFVTKHIGGGLANQILQTRKILESMGVSKESQVYLARMLTSGKSDDIKKAAQMIEKEKSAAEAQLKKEKEGQNNLVKSAQSTAASLTSLQDLLRQWIMDNVVQVLISIRDFMSMKWGDGGKSFNPQEKFMTKYAEANASLAAKTLAPNAARGMHEELEAKISNFTASQMGGFSKYDMSGTKITGSADVATLELFRKMQEAGKPMMEIQTLIMNRKFDAAYAALYKGMKTEMDNMLAIDDKRKGRFAKGYGSVENK